MNARNLRKHFSDYLEGNLGDAESRKFEEILDRSPELREDYELFVATHRMLTRLPSEEADGQFEARVLSRIGGVRQEKARGWLADFLPSWKYLAAATAASLLVGISLAVLLQHQVGGRSAEADPALTAGRQTGPGQVLTPIFPEGDPHSIHRELGEIASLVEDINELNERFQLGEEEILLGFSRDRELVLRPTEFYRRAVQAAERNPSADDSVRHAY